MPVAFVQKKEVGTSSASKLRTKMSTSAKTLQDVMGCFVFFTACLCRIIQWLQPILTFSSEVCLSPTCNWLDLSDQRPKVVFGHFYWKNWHRQFRPVSFDTRCRWLSLGLRRSEFKVSKRSNTFLGHIFRKKNGIGRWNWYHSVSNLWVHRTARNSRLCVTWVTCQIVLTSDPFATKWP